MNIVILQLYSKIELLLLLFSKYLDSDNLQ